jgi:hypothetical protein
MLANGSAGQVLTSAGTTLAPTWTTPTIGTVTSVGLSLPSFMTVTNSPVTGSGTLTGTLASQTANKVFASPDGSTGSPDFRILAASDIPSLDWSKITTGKPTTLAGYGITDASLSTHNHSVDGLSNVTIVGKANNDILQWDGTAWVNKSLSGAGIVTSETDPVVKAINGIVKSNGTVISAATAGTDYLTPTGSAALLTGFPTLNQNTTGTANIAGGTLGAIPYQTSVNNTGVLASTATANKVLMSGSSAAPVWSTPTFPNASATTRKIIVSDGTNWTASTETYAVPGASGNLLVSDGTNWTSTLPTFNQNTTGTAANVTGTVVVANGGTGATTLTGYVKGNGTSGMTASATIPGADVSGNISGNAATATTAGNVTGIVGVANGGTGLSTTTINQLLYSSAANTISGLATNNNGILVTSSGGVPSIGNTVGAALTMPSINLSASTNQLVLQSAGISGTLSWSPSGAAKTITFPDASGTVALVNAGANWLVGGNAPGGTAVLGTTDNSGINIQSGTGSITLGADAAAKSIAIGNSTGNTSLTLDAGTGSINIGSSGPSRSIIIGNTSVGNNQTIQIGGNADNDIRIGNNQNGGSLALGAMMTTGTISIGGTGAQTGNIDIGKGTGAQTLNIGTGGTGAKSINIGTGAVANTILIGNTTAGTKTGVNVAASTAQLHLGAGTASANEGAPLKFTSGTNLASAEAGSVEYDGKVFYSTPIGSSRGVSPSEYFIALTSNHTGNNDALVQNVFDNPTNGTINLSASTSYMFEGQYSISSTGGASVNLGTLFGGGATITSIAYTTITSKSTLPAVQSAVRTSFVTTAGNTIVTPTDANNDYITVIIKGIVRINAAGTFIPQFKFSGAPGAVPVVAANSYFKIHPIGTNIVNSIGNWN